MLNRRNIVKWLMLIICVSVLLCCIASADDNNSNDSESDKISDSVKEFENDPFFIAYRGIIPETVDQEWENSIADCWLNLNQIGPSYSEFDRSISGVAASDVIIVELGSAYKGEVNDSRIDAMYQKIENYCEEQEGISDIPVVFMWAQDEEDLPLPDYGPQIFEEVETESGFIAFRGTMPVITDASEKVEWEDSLVTGKRSLPRSEYMPYFVEFGGPVTSFGPGINGYLTVGFDPSTPEKVNESLIDEIYLIIDEHFEQEGINEVPVVFEWRGVPALDEELLPEDEIPNVSESGDISASGNEEEIAGNETINKMPGFTSIMSVLCLLFLVKIRR